MATAHLSVKVGKVGKATPHAEYISRLGKYAERLNQGEKLECMESGNMPKWAENHPILFWEAADQYERKNGYVYREHEIALPRELNAEQRAQLVREWVRQELGDRHAYTWAIHNKTALDGGEQPHVHLMFSERMNDGIERDPEQYFKRYNAKHPERGGAKKCSEQGTYTERKEALKNMRNRWEQLYNAHIDRHISGKTLLDRSRNHRAKISMKSLAEQGIDRKADPKLTPSESAALQRKAAAEREVAQVLREYRLTTPQPEIKLTQERPYNLVYRDLLANMNERSQIVQQRENAQHEMEKWAQIRAHSRQIALNVYEQFQERKQQKSGLFGLVQNKHDMDDLEQLSQRYNRLRAEFEGNDQAYQQARKQFDEAKEQTQPRLDELNREYQELKAEFDHIPMKDIDMALQFANEIFRRINQEKTFERISTRAKNEMKSAGYDGEFGLKLSGCLIIERAGEEMKRIEQQLQRDKEYKIQSASRDDWEMER